MGEENMMLLSHSQLLLDPSPMEMLQTLRRAWSCSPMDQSVSLTRPFYKLFIKHELYIAGNASSYLVPTQGITLVADIDDILRVTKIYQPDQGLQNSFVYPFTSWMNIQGTFVACLHASASLN